MHRNLYPALLSTLFTVQANAQLVINEVDYDQPSIDDREYIELKNTGSSPFDLGTVDIVLMSGAGGVATEYLRLNIPGTIAAGDYFVICGSTSSVDNCDFDASPDVDLVQNGPTDGVGIMRLSDSTWMDIFSYEGDVAGFFETAGLVDEDPTSGGIGGVNESKGASRYPDGSDTDNNNVDFRIVCSTPGAPNVADTVGCFSTAIICYQDVRTYVRMDAGNLVLYNGTDIGPYTVQLLDLRGSLLATRTGTAQFSGFSTVFPLGAYASQSLVVVMRTEAEVRTFRVTKP